MLTSYEQHPGKSVLIRKQQTQQPRTLLCCSTTHSDDNDGDEDGSPLWHLHTPPNIIEVHEKTHTHSRSTQINKREQSENENNLGGERKDEEDKWEELEGRKQFKNPKLWYHVDENEKRMYKKGCFS